MFGLFKKKYVIGIDNYGILRIGNPKTGENYLTAKKCKVANGDTIFKLEGVFELNSNLINTDEKILTSFYSPKPLGSSFDFGFNIEENAKERYFRNNKRLADVDKELLFSLVNPCEVHRNDDKTVFSFFMGTLSTETPGLLDGMAKRWEGRKITTVAIQGQSRFQNSFYIEGLSELLSKYDSLAPLSVWTYKA